LLDYLFRYFGGKTTIIDIAERHAWLFDRLAPTSRPLHREGTVTLERLEINRAVPRCYQQEAEQ